MNGQRKAFTLIELLVVIAIIAILAAILFPVFAKARDRAKASACLNNEKQIGMAVMQYANDNDEKYPMNRMAVPRGTWTWKRAIFPYVKSYDVFKCGGVQNYWAVNPQTGAPGDESNLLPEFYVDKSKATWMPTSYGYAGFLYETAGDGVTARPRSLSDAKDPSNIIMVLNTRSGYPDLGPWMIRERYDPRTGREVTGTAGAKYAYGAFVQHQGRIPMIYCDGHVQSVKLSQTIEPMDQWRTKAQGYNDYRRLQSELANIAQEYR